MLFTFLTTVTRWSRSTFNFYALISQNLAGEFMRKFIQHFLKKTTCNTLTAEADRVLCQLVMFSTLFPLNVQNEIQLLSGVLCFSWLVCLNKDFQRHFSICLREWKLLSLYMFHRIIFLLLLIVSSPFAILISVPFVFSRSWTSLAGVVKMPRVSNAFEDYTSL